MWNRLKKYLRKRPKRFLFLICLLCLIVTIPLWIPWVLFWGLSYYGGIYAEEITFRFPCRIQIKAITFQQSATTQNISFWVKKLSTEFDLFSLLSSGTPYRFHHFSIDDFTLDIFLKETTDSIETSSPSLSLEELSRLLPPIFIQELQNKKFALNLYQVDSTGAIRSLRYETSIVLNEIHLQHLKNLRFKMSESGKILPGEPTQNAQIEILWNEVPIHPILDFLGFPPPYSDYLKTIGTCQLRGKIIPSEKNAFTKELLMELDFQGFRLGKALKNFKLESHLEWSPTQFQLLYSILKTDISHVMVTPLPKNEYQISLEVAPHELPEGFTIPSLDITSPLKAKAIYQLQTETLSDISVDMDSFNIFQHRLQHLQLKGSLQYRDNTGNLQFSCKKIEGPLIHATDVSLRSEKVQLKEGHHLLIQAVDWKFANLKIPFSSKNYFQSGLFGSLEQLNLRDLHQSVLKIQYQNSRLQLNKGILFFEDQTYPLPEGRLEFSGKWDGSVPSDHFLSFDDGFSTIQGRQEGFTFFLEKGILQFQPDLLKALNLSLSEPLQISGSRIDWNKPALDLVLKAEGLRIQNTLDFLQLELALHLEKVAEKYRVSWKNCLWKHPAFTLFAKSEDERLKLECSLDLAQFEKQTNLSWPLVSGTVLGDLSIPRVWEWPQEHFLETIGKELEGSLRLQDGRWKSGVLCSANVNFLCYPFQPAFWIQQLTYHDPENQIQIRGKALENQQLLEFQPESRLQLKSLGFGLDLSGSLDLSSSWLKLPAQFTKEKSWPPKSLNSEQMLERVFAYLPETEIFVGVSAQDVVFENREIPLENVKIHLQGRESALQIRELFLQVKQWTLQGSSGLLPLRLDDLRSKKNDIEKFPLELLFLQNTKSSPRQFGFSGDFSYQNANQLGLQGKLTSEFPFPQWVTFQLDARKDSRWSLLLKEFQGEWSWQENVFHFQGDGSYQAPKWQGNLEIATKTPFQNRIDGVLKLPISFDEEKKEIHTDAIFLEIKGDGPVPDLGLPLNGLDLGKAGSASIRIEAGRIQLDSSMRGEFYFPKWTLQGTKSRLFFQGFGLYENDPSRTGEYWTRPIALWNDFHIEFFPWKGSFSQDHFLNYLDQVRIQLFHRETLWADFLMKQGRIGVVRSRFEIPVPIHFSTQGEIPVQQAYVVLRPIFEHILMRDLSGTLRVENGIITRDGIEVYPWLREVCSRFSYDFQGNRHQLIVNRVNGPAIYGCVWTEGTPFQFWVKNRGIHFLQGASVSYEIERKGLGKRRKTHQENPIDEPLPPLYCHLQDLLLKLDEINMHGVRTKMLAGRFGGGTFDFGDTSFSWKTLILEIEGRLRRISLETFHQQTQFFSGILSGDIDGYFQIAIDFSPLPPGSPFEDIWRLIRLEKMKLRLWSVTQGEVRIDSLLGLKENLEFTQRMGVDQFHYFRYKQMLVYSENEGKDLHLIINKGNLSFEGTIPTEEFVRITNKTRPLEVARLYWNWRQISDLNGKFFLNFNDRSEEEKASPLIYRLFWDTGKGGRYFIERLIEFVPDNKELQNKILLFLENVFPFVNGVSSEKE